MDKLPDDLKELASVCNDKHVKVVQAILSGNYSSNTKAYQSVYVDVDADSARSAVARLLAIDNVSELHSRLKELNVLSGVLSRAEALKILSDMAKTSIGDLVDFSAVQMGDDDSGLPVYQSVWSFKDKNKIPDHALRSISELATTPQGFKIKQHDQKAAIKQLSEMLGWNEQEADTGSEIKTVKVIIEDAS